MAVDDMGHFKSSRTVLADRSQLQAGFVLVKVWVIADLHLLSGVVEDPVAFAFARVESLFAPWIDQSIDVVLEGFRCLF
ncbi:MAG: hypothetical protein QNL17_02080 [Synechococcus sp. ChSW.bin.154]|jgi:hypothetical protein